MDRKTVPQCELRFYFKPSTASLICAFLPSVRRCGASLFHKISYLTCTPAGTEGLCFDTALFTTFFENSKSCSGSLRRAPSTVTITNSISQGCTECTISTSRQPVLYYSIRVQCRCSLVFQCGRRNLAKTPSRDQSLH